MNDSSEHILGASEFVSYLTRDLIIGRDEQTATLAYARGAIHHLACLLEHELGKQYLSNSINRAVDAAIEAALDAQARKEVA